VAAFELLEKIQATPGPVDLHHRITRARQAGWHDVEFMLQYCRYVHAEVRGDHTPDILDQMQGAALADGDVALEATVLALRSTPVSLDGSCVDALAQYFAQAVALLDDGVGSTLARPGAYIVCAQAIDGSACGSWRSRCTSGPRSSWLDRCGRSWRASSS
jgi:hypothetical protein